ncbi:MAG TPA: replication-relaxation family protein [Streptosporangiaceae bacterium]
MTIPPVPDTRPRVSAALIAQLARRLTPRDHQILELVHEHQVLTTSQITDLFFDNQRVAAERLAILYQHRALDRTQPRAWKGSAPYHYVLDEAGAVVLAADRGLTRAEFRYRKDHAAAVLVSQKLGHTVGVNGFFAALAAAARRAPGTDLVAWWPERRCAAEWQRRIRPDGYGRWRDTLPGGPAETDFFLEYDTGTEPLGRVAAKLTAYTALLEATAIATPVLFWLPSPRREAGLRRLIAATATPAATATARGPGSVPAHPAGPVWLPAGQHGPRLHLAGLAHAWRRRSRGPSTWWPA